MFQKSKEEHKINRRKYLPENNAQYKDFDFLYPKYNNFLQSKPKFQKKVFKNLYQVTVKREEKHRMMCMEKVQRKSEFLKKMRTQREEKHRIKPSKKFFGLVHKNNESRALKNEDLGIKRKRKSKKKRGVNDEFDARFLKFDSHGVKKPVKFTKRRKYWKKI